MTIFFTSSFGACCFACHTSFRGVVDDRENFAQLLEKSGWYVDKERSIVICKECCAKVLKIESAGIRCTDLLPHNGKPKA